MMETKESPQTAEGARTRKITFRDAITEALQEEMKRDPRIFLMGEDLRFFFGGGSFGVTPTDKFYKVFGSERIRDTPISETAFIGAGIGAAITGMKPVVELIFADFLGVCFDQIHTNAGMLRYMTGGQYKVPFVLRTTIGAGMSFGPTHSQNLAALFVHSPGLKVVLPSTPYDAKGLLKTALRDEDPIIFLEHKGLYGTDGMVPENEYTVPFGQADVKKTGKHATVVAIGAMVHRTLEAAGELEAKGIDIEVIDPRTLVPLDKAAIINSVKKTSRLVVVDEDYERCGMASEISSIVAEEAFDYLESPIKRIAMPTVPIPFAQNLEKVLIPDKQRIIKAVTEIVK